MKICRDAGRFGSFLAMLVGASLLLGGCGASIHYSYDPAADFKTGKTYSWQSGGPANRQGPLIEKTVRYYADQSLKEKGYTLSSDKPDFILSMNYESEYSEPYKLRFLDLYVYRMPGKEPIWQGTAAGTIHADAASSDLAEAVNRILLNFPPKR